MKAQLEALAQELISEVKDIKDLTKQELPHIAKEYIRYNTFTAGLNFILSLFMMFIASMLVIYSHFETNNDIKIPCCVIGLFVFFSEFIVFLINLGTFLEFKMQPRRMAIKAIIDLLGK